MTEEFSLIRTINWHISRSFHPEIAALLEMKGRGNALGFSDIRGKFGGVILLSHITQRSK